MASGITIYSVRNPHKDQNTGKDFVQGPDIIAPVAWMNCNLINVPVLPVRPQRLSSRPGNEHVCDTRTARRFFNVAGYLFCSILCFAMVLVGAGCIARDGVQNTPLSVWLPLFGLIVVIVIAVLWLVHRLFPAWVRAGHPGAVLEGGYGD